MLTTARERLIQFKRIAVLCDLSSDAEKMVRYAGSLARWYGSELLLVHAEPPEFYPSVPMESFPVLVRQGNMEALLQELEDHRPSLLALATHGREGIRKWFAGSVMEKIFRQVQWPVLVLGPGVANNNASLQKQFERILYATDLSGVSLRALQYAAGIACDHEAQLTALYVDSNPSEGFAFDHVMELQRLEDWLRDQIDGLSETIVGVRCVAEFGKPEKKIVEAANERKADLVVVGARGLGAAAGLASHFLGGTAYDVVCSSPCPVLIVPQLR